MSKNNGGRPRFAPGVARKRKLSIPLRPSEDDAIREAAKKDKARSAAEWARERLVEAAKP